MRHIIYKIVFFLALILLSSGCKINKNILLLENATEGVELTGLPPIPKEYRLRQGDNLYVNIQSALNPQVTQMFSSMPTTGGGSTSTQNMFTTPAGQALYGFFIDPIGEIKLPVLGNIKVIGLTVNEAETNIRTKALEILKEAEVKVLLLNFRITMSGEIRSPNVLSNFNEKISILEAIHQSGGITDFASISKVKVIRQTETGTKTILIDLSTTDLFASEAFYLQPNDFVYVPPYELKNFRLNVANITMIMSTVTSTFIVLRYLGIY